jgi:cell fate regulator YaaT (PSP1 superfamily)
MCCLQYEEEAYEDLNSKLPCIGDFVETPEGLKGEVVNISVLKQIVKLLVELDSGDKEVREYKASDLKFKPKKRRQKSEGDDTEAKKLEAMDRQENKSKLD